MRTWVRLENSKIQKINGTEGIVQVCHFVDEETGTGRLSKLSKAKHRILGNMTLASLFFYSIQRCPTEYSELEYRIHLLSSYSLHLLQSLIVCHPDNTNSYILGFLLIEFFHSILYPAPTQNYLLY